MVLKQIMCHFHSSINLGFNPEFGVKLWLNYILTLTKDKVTQHWPQDSKDSVMGKNVPSLLDECCKASVAFPVGLALITQTADG